MVNRQTPSWPLSWLSWPLFNHCPAVSLSRLSLVQHALSSLPRLIKSSLSSSLSQHIQKISQRENNVTSSETESGEKEVIQTTLVQLQFLFTSRRMDCLTRCHYPDINISKTVFLVLCPHHLTSASLSHGWAVVGRRPGQGCVRSDWLASHGVCGGRSLW